MSVQYHEMRMREAIDNVSAAIYALWDVHYKDMTDEQRIEVAKVAESWRLLTIGSLITRQPPITNESNGEDDQ